MNHTSCIPDTPYNNLPELPPAAGLEHPSILKKAITANRLLAELKGLSMAIPNPAILISSITLQEAQSSSEIENILTTSDDLYQAFSNNEARPDPAVKEVLRYREALWHGYNHIRERPLLTTNVFTEIARTITAQDTDIRKLPGTRIVNSRGEVLYTPPEGEKLLRDKLQNLEGYIHSEADGIDPLIKMAVIHYQFEAIHPYYDGNGRTGRIINVLYLVQQGLLDLPLLYMSKYIIGHKNDYYHLLRNVSRNGEWEPWVMYMLDVIAGAAGEACRRIREILALLDETADKARDVLPPYMYSKELIELIFEQPYTSIRMLTDRGMAKRQTAAVYLKKLEETGFLKSRKSGRSVLYLNTALYELLSS